MRLMTWRALFISPFLVVRVSHNPHRVANETHSDEEYAAYDGNKDCVVLVVVLVVV